MKKILLSIFCVFNITASLPWTKDMDIGGDIKIVNGHEVDISKVPHTVAFIEAARQFCVGSILSPKHILTVALCVGSSGPVRDIFVRAGSKDWSSGGVLVKVDNITTHPKFDPFYTYDYDIAIVHLAEPLTFSENIAPIKLADKTYRVKDGDNCSLAGWGFDGQTNPANLKRVEVPTMNFDQCQKIFYKNYGLKISSRHICTKHPEGGHNGCEYDRGAAVLHNGTAVGVISYGGPCMLPGSMPYSPAVNTKLADYADWIQSFLD